MTRKMKTKTTRTRRMARNRLRRQPLLDIAIARLHAQAPKFKSSLMEASHERTCLCRPCCVCRLTSSPSVNLSDMRTDRSSTPCQHTLSAILSWKRVHSMRRVVVQRSDRLSSRKTDKRITFDQRQSTRDTCASRPPCRATCRGPGLRCLPCGPLRPCSPLALAGGC